KARRFPVRLSKRSRSIVRIRWFIPKWFCTGCVRDVAEVSRIMKFSFLLLLIVTLLCPIRIHAGPATSATTQAMIPADQSTPRGALRVLAAAMDAGDGA